MQRCQKKSGASPTLGAWNPSLAKNHDPIKSVDYVQSPLIRQPSRRSVSLQPAVIGGKERLRGKELFGNLFVDGQGMDREAASFELAGN